MHPPCTRTCGHQSAVGAEAGQDEGDPSVPADRALFHELEAAIAAGSPSRCAAMLWQLTALLDANRLDAAEDVTAVFDTLFLRLTDVIEGATRAELARRLSRIPHAPPRILGRLSADEDPDVCGPVLEHATGLAEADLVSSALTRGQPQLLAISRRRTLAESITDILVDRGDSIVLRTVAANRGARFSDAGFTRLVARADQDDDLQVVTACRDDLPRHLFLRLLTKASEVVRARIGREGQHSPDLIRRIVAEVTRSLAPRPAIDVADYAEGLRAVRRLRRTGALTEATVAAFARDERLQHSVCALAAIADLPVEIVADLMLQPQAEGLLLLAKGLGFGWSTARLLLDLHALYGGTGDADAYLGHFERMTRSAASAMIALKRREPGTRV